MFAWYAQSLGGVTGFFPAFHGLGHQPLWGNGGWMSRNGAMLSGLLALVGSSLFAGPALQLHTVSQVTS